MHRYLAEISELKSYYISIIVVMILSFSVYFYLDEYTIARIGDEDHLFEWMSSIIFLLCSVIFAYLTVSKRNLIFLVLAAAFFIGFGEEISWGQRIIDFNTPEKLYSLNMQKEFNFHNIATWEINFLYKVFTLAFGIVLPLIVFHSGIFSRLARKFKIPVPPVSIGIFFLIDWLVFKFFLEMVLKTGYTEKYYFALTEIYEFITSFVMLTIAVFFLNTRKVIPAGEDIKERIPLVTNLDISQTVAL